MQKQSLGAVRCLPHQCESSLCLFLDVSVGVGYGSVVTMSPQYEYWSFNLC